MRSPGFDHEKLRAYQEAVRFNAWVAPLLETLPAKIAARDQLDRAATSIALNIAEGNGRRHAAERCRHLDAARGSALECAACLDLLVAKERVDHETVRSGKEILLAVVSLVSGLLAHFGNDARTMEIGEDAERVENVVGEKVYD